MQIDDDKNDNDDGEAEPTASSTLLKKKQESEWIMKNNNADIELLNDVETAKPANKTGLCDIGDRNEATQEDRDTTQCDEEDSDCVLVTPNDVTITTDYETRSEGSSTSTSSSESAKLTDDIGINSRKNQINPTHKSVPIVTPTQKNRRT